MAAAQEPVRPRRTLPALAVAAAVSLGTPQPGCGEELKNWFGDPFFQVLDAVPGCPVPRGPWMTESEMRRAAHARVERGTSCWLAGQCEKSNAYHYDAGIAQRLRARFDQARGLPAASLWVTVQRRIVWVEGCSPQRDAASRVRRLLEGVPDVEQLVVQIARRPEGPLPYVARDRP